MASLRQLGTILSHLENAAPELSEMPPEWHDETLRAEEDHEFEATAVN